MLHEKTGKFSYDPPKAWQIAEFPGLKYRISHGPREDDFAPNINVVTEPFAGLPAQYAEASLAAMRKGFSNMRILGKDQFLTTDAETVVRVLVENEQQGRLLRQAFHFMVHSGRGFVVTCTALAANGQAMDSIFEETVKTFRFHQ
jgi:hypothetical protein